MDNVAKVNFKVRSADSVQGFYTMAADGTAYGFKNVRGAKIVLPMLNDAEQQFHANKPPKVEIKVLAASLFDRSPEPNSTSVIRAFTRVRPVPLAANSLNKSVGRDHLWILARDLKQMSAAAAAGNSFPMPKDLKMRLVRFNLVDNVRGQPDPWELDQVKRANITMKPIGRRGSEMIYTFTGDFLMRTADSKRGLEGRITGELEVTEATGKVAWFRAIADATAWGDSKFTAHSPPGKFPLVVAMLNVDDTLAGTIEPDGLPLDGAYFYASERKNQR